MIVRSPLEMHWPTSSLFHDEQWVAERSGHQDEPVPVQAKQDHLNSNINHAHFTHAGSSDHQKPTGNALTTLFFKDLHKRLESLELAFNIVKLNVKLRLNYTQYASFGIGSSEKNAHTTKAYYVSTYEQDWQLGHLTWNQSTRKWCGRELDSEPNIKPVHSR